MTKKQIIIDVAEDGEVIIVTKGYTGKACLEDSRFLKELLGKEIAVQLCPLYYRRGNVTMKKHIPLCG